MLTMNRHGILNPDLAAVAGAARAGLLRDSDTLPAIVTGSLIHTDPRCPVADDGQLEILTVLDLGQLRDLNICGCSLRVTATFDDLVDDVKAVMPAMSWLAWAEEVSKNLSDSTIVDHSEPDLLAFDRLWRPVAAKQLLSERRELDWPTQLEDRAGELATHLQAVVAAGVLPGDVTALAAQCHQRLTDQGLNATVSRDAAFEHDDMLQVELVHAAKQALASADPTTHQTWVVVANPFDAAGTPCWLDAVRFGLHACAAPHESATVTWNSNRSWWLKQTRDYTRPVNMVEAAVMRVPTLVALVVAHMRVPLMALTSEPIDLGTAKAALELISQYEPPSKDDNTVDVGRFVAAAAAACAA